MTEVRLGFFPREGDERDAVHVAIISVIAGERLNSGDKVQISSVDRRAYLADTECIGVVDPFLTNGVSEGNPFWLCLYPGSVTGMRHHWEHPAFDDEPQPESKPTDDDDDDLDDFSVGRCSC